MIAKNQKHQDEANFEFIPEFLNLAYSHIQKYPKSRQQSAVMPLLDLAQRQNDGWLSQSAIEYVAKLLEMAPVRVLEVATFYTMYNLKPVGKFHVQVCTNLPCWLRGATDVVKVCKKTLEINVNETTNDNLFTLSEVECLGACVNAPMMQINDDFYEDLTEQSANDVLCKLRQGQKVNSGSQIGRHTCEPSNGLTSLKHQAKKVSQG